MGGQGREERKAQAQAMAEEEVRGVRYMSGQESYQVNLCEKPRENRMWSGRKVGLAKCFEEEH